MQSFLRLFLVFPLFFVVAGCTSGTFFVKNTGKMDSPDGIPYYSPQPYLLVSHVVDPKTKTIVSTARVFYLPDPAQKHFILVKKGSGTFEGSIHLEDGWRLTAINQKSDTKTAETIEAISSIPKTLLSTAGKTYTPRFEEEEQRPSIQPFHLYKIDLQHNRLVEVK